MICEKVNGPVLVRREADVSKLNKCNLWAVYLERDAFWKIEKVCPSDYVKVMYKGGLEATFKGDEYANACIQHNQKLIYKEVLDDAERKYLKAVIRPFRDKVNYISRVKDASLEENYILISCNRAYDCITLPNFKRDTMYKGMKEGIKYSIEALGL